MVCQHARKGNKDQVTTLITSRGINIQEVAVEGRSVLHFAVVSGNVDLVTTLLSFRCDPNAVGPFGELPIGLAAKAGHDEVVLALATGGADLNLPDGHQLTCLDHLQSRGDRATLLLRLQEATGLVACRLGCGAVLHPDELDAHESSLCKNSSVACPYCYDIFTISDFTNQHDCKMEPVKCPNCEEWTTASQLTEHERKCQLTATYACENCHDQVLVRQRIHHRQHECLERIVECDNRCGVMYPAKHRVQHVLHSCPRRVVDCSQCKGGFEERDLATHMTTVCSARLMKCRFGCINIPLGSLPAHEAAHLEKDVLLWTPEELLWWIELHEDFRGDIQLAYRVKRIFCDRAFFKSAHPKSFQVCGELGGVISGRLLSSLYRDKLYQLLVRSDVPRPFSHTFVEKIGCQLTTACPRGCGETFLLKDRKEHADFCTHGMATCLRCGKSVVRKEMTRHRSNKEECQSKHGVRWWPSVVVGGNMHTNTRYSTCSGEELNVKRKVVVPTRNRVEEEETSSSGGTAMKMVVPLPKIFKSNIMGMHTHHI